MASLSVFLNVQDIDRSLKFYKALGFKVTSSTKRDGKVAYADLALDGAELGLGSIPSSDDPAFQSWVATPLGAGVVVYITLDGGLDKLFAKAKKAGAVVEYEPQDRSYGRVAGINDPDGYVLAFHQEVKAAPAKRAKKVAKRPAKKAKKAVKARR